MLASKLLKYDRRLKKISNRIGKTQQSTKIYIKNMKNQQNYEMLLQQRLAQNVQDRKYFLYKKYLNYLTKQNGYNPMVSNFLINSYNNEAKGTWNKLRFKNIKQNEKKKQYEDFFLMPEDEFESTRIKVEAFQKYKAKRAAKEKKYQRYHQKFIKRTQFYNSYRFNDVKQTFEVARDIGYLKSKELDIEIEKIDKEIEKLESGMDLLQEKDDEEVGEDGESKQGEKEEGITMEDALKILHFEDRIPTTLDEINERANTLIALNEPKKGKDGSPYLCKIITGSQEFLSTRLDELSELSAKQMKEKGAKEENETQQTKEKQEEQSKATEEKQEEQSKATEEKQEEPEQSKESDNENSEQHKEQQNSEQTEKKTSEKSE
eukprot:TRINITY_DN1244_c0_g1_i1.p1 TRINITY_DN1244_c0_g1~~TRINITY_DN1244_c0_g1_i1.p1  ORF type:complete len:376 (-),score=115.93 TRINITY_DN1244_c0_g1_i1:17-1144(-)